MQKDDLVYVGHMLDMARKATAKVHGRSRAEYDADEDLRLALTHIVQTLGEAARRVSLPFQQAHPEIPWRVAWLPVGRVQLLVEAVVLDEWRKRATILVTSSCAASNVSGRCSVGPSPTARAPL